LQYWPKAGRQTMAGVSQPGATLKKPAE